MNKVKRRALIIVAFAVLLVLGFCCFMIRWEAEGESWADFPSNNHVYNNGTFVAGQVRDREGRVLLYTDDNGKRCYIDDYQLRRATLYAVGDVAGNIGGAATDIFHKQMMGYSLVNGVYSYSGKGSAAWLSIDAELNRTAYEALNGRSGCVAVMDYHSGQLICMVSSPGFDPADPPSDPNYLNKFLSGVYTPGSIFKLVTAFAAIEELDMEGYGYYCDGSAEYGGSNITCQHAHGQLDFYGALAQSCNGAFADIAQKLGGEKLAAYAEKAGLCASHQVSGFTTAAGSFDIAPEGSWDLGWSGAGQYHDQVNPCAMLRFVSAIANGGKAVEPELLYRCSTLEGVPYWFDLSTDHQKLMSSSTANELKEMMANNVRSNYGVDNFPNLPMCAKSGTAEVGAAYPHAWFVGFLNSDKYPYAFVVLVENGGSGVNVAGSVANRVLQAACFGDD